MTSLSDLYDADRRTVDLEVHRMAADVPIPHPLIGVEYADGVKLGPIDSPAAAMAIRNYLSTGNVWGK